MGLFDNFDFNKLKAGLSKTREKIVNTINETITGRATVDDKTLDEIEEILVTSDIGYDTAIRVIDHAKIRLHNEKGNNLNILQTVKKELQLSLEKYKEPVSLEEKIRSNKPYIILIVGINGAGKTTTIGKLAHNFKSAGLKVIIGAADTFRAAANEQLEIWSKRAGVSLIQKNKGADPSSVAFETVEIAVKDNYDVVLIDTAGRLHNKTHLMEELNKIKRVISKGIPNAPHETYLVIDGNTGQNAIVQAEEFSKVTDISGLIVTKLDGTAKGGVIFQICAKQNVPVKYIGIGESIDDLQTFNSEMFIDAIFE